MKRQRVLGIVFLTWSTPVRTAIDGAVEGWLMGGQEIQPANKTAGLPR